MTGLFPASISAEAQAKAVENVGKFLKASEAEYEGFKDAKGGWVVEELDNEKVEGGKAKAYVMVIGWPDVETHMKYRETQVFKDNIGLLREGVVDSSIHHVKVHTF